MDVIEEGAQEFFAQTGVSAFLEDFVEQRVPTGQLQDGDVVVFLVPADAARDVHPLLEQVEQILVDDIDVGAQVVDVFAIVGGLAVGVAHDDLFAQEDPQVVRPELLFGIAERHLGLAVRFDHQAFQAQVHGALAEFDQILAVAAHMGRVGEEGLYGCLPEGTTEFEGDMEGYPIEFSITKSSDLGNVTAIYKNVKYGTAMNLTGESLPADDGNISFFGKDGNTDWTFYLSGDCENVTGTAQSGDSKLDMTLHKK